MLEMCFGCDPNSMQWTNPTSLKTPSLGITQGQGWTGIPRILWVVGGGVHPPPATFAHFFQGHQFFRSKFSLSAFLGGMQLWFGVEVPEDKKRKQVMSFSLCASAASLPVSICLLLPVACAAWSFSVFDERRILGVVICFGQMAYLLCITSIFVFFFPLLSGISVLENLFDFCMFLSFVVFQRAASYNWAPPPPPQGFS